MLYTAKFCSSFWAEKTVATTPCGFTINFYRAATVKVDAVDGIGSSSTVYCRFFCYWICFVASFFQAAAAGNYDSVIETEGFPPTTEDIWILGSTYNLSNGRRQLNKISCFITAVG